MTILTKLKTFDKKNSGFFFQIPQVGALARILNIN
jgi:hypothetical protein